MSARIELLGNHAGTDSISDLAKGRSQGRGFFTDASLLKKIKEASADLRRWGNKTCVKIERRVRFV